jgi:catechol 2,3-dioxygenase-like lactoylglutathione lyase family enzyme
MSVSFLKHVAFEIPEADRETAITFYTDFGLQYSAQDKMLAFGCKGRIFDSLYLIPGSDKKRIHHVAMGASSEGLAEVIKNVASAGLDTVAGPQGFPDSGIWFTNPHGLLFHVDACGPEQALSPEQPFLINSPGNYSRINVASQIPKSEIGPIYPRKLGHVLLFTPNLDESIEFLIDVLGMRLSDRSQNAVAFTHCQGGSDHHVIALAQSSGIGFHHASFMVGTPDEVGIAGQRMIENGHERGWGFGRHAIGSNFFHYIRDPWGSYAEYYADIDYIGDSDSWEPTNWPLEDSLHTWGPNPPEDMVHNYELD